LAFGGNKTRKLEFLLAEAQAHGAKTLITAGAVQSNHCRQTVAAAARFGFDCILILTGEPPPIPSGNQFIDQLFNTEIVYTTISNRETTLKETFDSAWKNGRRPYLIPYGGSNAIGAAAYAIALKELLDQSNDTFEGNPPDWIVFPSSSGGTQAGLVVGSHMFNYNGNVLGISVDEQEIVLQARVAKLATEVSIALGEHQPFEPNDILVNANYLGGGYGVLGEPEHEAIQLFAQTEGILLDPVYTGRAAAGLLDLIHSNYFLTDQSILFWHTGGTPALFADVYRDILMK
jgi:1-aminocyclopropane-1-carboxylate deaminase/D-cysteine desulfhydrase-like pyridoxal-dependent ACC family enzyme